MEDGLSDSVDSTLFGVKICRKHVFLHPIGSMYAIYGNMDPINIPPMLVYIYIPYMDPMGMCSPPFFWGCRKSIGSNSRIGLRQLAELQIEKDRWMGTEEATFCCETSGGGVGYRIFFKMTIKVPF